MSFQIGVVGGSGYTGAELLRLLHAHPSAEVVLATGDSNAGARVASLYPSLAAAYPAVERMHLLDYKVRVINAQEGTAAKVRVSIESTDGEHVWGTVGVSDNIIQASWLALVDSFEYRLGV